MEKSKVIHVGRTEPKVEKQPTEVEILKAQLEDSQKRTAALSKNLDQLMDLVSSNY